MSYPMVLIPCHGLEDFPSDLADDAAASLLNAFALAWRPEVWRSQGGHPRWSRADEPQPVQPGQLVLFAEAVQGWAPCNWPETAREAGAIVVTVGADRQAAREALWQALGVANDTPAATREFARDLEACGAMWLLLELLGRKMRELNSPNETRLRKACVAAAAAMAAGQVTEAEAALRDVTETLHEHRERFYPVECSLVDLVLCPDDDLSTLRHVAGLARPWTLMVEAPTLERLATTEPALLETLVQSRRQGHAAIMGCEGEQLATPLVTAEQLLDAFAAAHDMYRSSSGAPPRTWGRKSFALCATLPGVLKYLGYHGALHFAFDDGVFPDEESTKFRWQGTDGTTISASSRIPLAAEGAAGLFRLPERLSESMDADHAAGVCLVRWPDGRGEAFEDLERVQRYAPVFGVWKTFDQLFTSSEAPGAVKAHAASTYLSPYLWQAVIRRQANPVSQHAERWALSGVQHQRGMALALEALIAGRWSTHADEAAASVLARWFAAPGGRAGHLVLNTRPETRTVIVPLTDWKAPPHVAGQVRAVEWSEVRAAVVELPPCGYVWLESGESNRQLSRTEVPLAEDFAVRNETWQVELNRTTGGIRQLRRHSSRINRLSQYVAWRFPRAKTITNPETRDIEAVHYAVAECVSQRLLNAGTAMGRVETTSEIRDPVDRTLLALVRQTTTLWRERQVVDIVIEAEQVLEPKGDPWQHGLVCRWAWADEATSLWRGVLNAIEPIAGERIESLEFIDLATERTTTTLVLHGWPYHRKSGARSCDTLLVVEGEQCRRWEFSIALDQPNSLSAARNVTTPAAIVPLAGPPPMGSTGWLLEVTPQGVQLLSQIRLQSPIPSEADRPHAMATQLLLQETSGTAITARITSFRTPVSAWKIDSEGSPQDWLTIENGSIMVPLRARELTAVAVLWG